MNTGLECGLFSYTNCIVIFDKRLGTSVLMTKTNTTGFSWTLNGLVKTILRKICPAIVVRIEVDVHVTLPGDSFILDE